jgi:hypothetical protein
MKAKMILAGALLLAALAPGLASAEYVLDTGTPPAPGGTVPILNKSDWYAAEFTLGPNATISQLSAYLTPDGSGSVGSTFTWVLYSASGTFLGANRENPVGYVSPTNLGDSVTGTFEASGWNSTTVNWAPGPGTYWIALQVSSGQTSGLDLPNGDSTSTGTAPTLAFAFAGTNGRYANLSDGFGVQVSAVPLPAAAWLLGSGLVGLASLRRRRRS